MADAASILVPFSVRSSRAHALHALAGPSAVKNIGSSRKVSHGTKLSLHRAPVCFPWDGRLATDNGNGVLELCYTSSVRALAVHGASSPSGLQITGNAETRGTVAECLSEDGPAEPKEEALTNRPEEAKARVRAGARQVARRIFESRLKGLEVTDAVKAAGLQVSTTTMNVLILELGNLNDCDGAVEAFKAFRRMSVQPNHIVCTTLIFILGKGRRWTQARQVFEWGLQQLPDTSPDLFQTFIITCAKCRNPDAAIKAFAELQQRGIKPGRVAYMGVVSALLSGGRSEEAQEWLLRMRQQGLQPGVVDYEAMLAACARGRRAADAVSIFESMREHGVQASPVSYNCLLSAYEKCGMWRDALRLLLDMEHPDDVAWCTTLSACAKAGKASVTMELLKRMQDSGRTPCVVAWSCAVEAHRKSGDWQRAESVLQAMTKAGIVPNEVTWGSLMACYTTAGETDRAISVLDRAVNPGVVLWTAAIAAACGQLEKAQSLFARMQAAGCKPNVATFTAMIKAFGDAGEWECAEEAFQNILHLRLRPNAVTCAALLRAYARGRQLGRAGALFRRMSSEYGVQPDKYAYTALVRACGLCRDWQRAEAVFLHMQAAGVAPDGVIYQELLRAYEAQGQIEKAIRLMDVMATTLN